LLLLVCGAFYLSNIYLDGAFSELCTSFHFNCYSHASSIHCIFIFYQVVFEKNPEECNIYVLENDIMRNIPIHLHRLCIYIVNIELNNNCFNNTILSCVKPQTLTDKTPLTEASRNRDYQKESLNSDGQHYHQYQQNKQSPLT
jgi:hypothetical protein